MDRYFKITANDAGANHEIILKVINAFQAVENVNMNVNFIKKVVECDERGQELSTGEKQCNLPVVAHWLTIAEELPEQGENVLTYTPTTEIAEEQIRLIKYGSLKSGFPTGVTHWKHLDKPTCY